MDSLLLSRRDLEFLLYEWLNVEDLVKHDRFKDFNRETFNAILDICEGIATDLFAPHNKKNDQCEPHFDGEKVTINSEVGVALKAFIEAGLMGASQDYELGGMQLPRTIEAAGLSYFTAANIGTTGYPALAVGNASTIREHGSPAQIEAFAKQIFAGRYFGTMCLSEPQAGSSLSDITTRADYEGESPLGPQYRLKGRKMWISGGDHELTENIVHLVLAKVPDADGKLPSGVKGISLFIVPKYLCNEAGVIGERNDVVLAGLNHKMGQRGITNTLLNFGEGTRHRPLGQGGAVGYLLGELGQGLACMFHMMNFARIGVGLGATALGYTGYLHALDYARNRPQGRHIQRDGKVSDSPQVMISEHADVKRMLLAQKSYVEGALALNLYCTKLYDQQLEATDDAERERSKLLLDLLTPICKSWPSQWCLEANNLAIQVHGGYGYTRDYNVEQFYRDNRLNPIHEGTHGIQALDLLGRKVIMKQGGALRLLAGEVTATITNAKAHPELAAYADELGKKLQEVSATTMRLWGDMNPQKALLNATTYLEAFGHIVLAWIWLEQALKAVGKDDDFYRGKLAACRYFYEFELPKTGPQLALLGSQTTLLADMQTSWF
jgi:alkylation response protein AidB-like acyl-CoA dehydrogenase